MNTNFKVVFNKARGALMVANEITSSVQAKGTKTVVAAAVAAVMAGVAGTAMAADIANLELKDGATVTVSTVENQKSVVVSGSAFATETAGGEAVAFDKDKHTLGTTTELTLNNGGIIVTGQTDERASINGTVGSIGVNATSGASGALNVTGEIALDTGNITLKTYDGKTAGQDATVSGGATVSLKAGTLTTSAEKASDATVAGAGTANLKASGNVTLGIAADPKKLEDGSDYNLVIGTKTVVQSENGNVVYNKGSLQNSADLTLSGVEVSLGEGVVIANGKDAVLSLTGTTVNLNADYVDQEGRLIVSGTTAANLNGDIKASSIKVGAVETASDKKETNNVILTDGGNIGKNSVVTTDALTFAGKGLGLNVSGSLTSADTTVSASGATLTVNAASADVDGTASLGKLTIAGAEGSELNDLTVTNQTNTAVTADSLVIEYVAADDKADPKVAEKKAGTFTLAKGDFTVGTMTVGKGGAVSIANGSTFTINAEGAAVNAGKVTNNGELVIAEGVAFDNTTGEIADASTPSGSVIVAGVLTNHATVEEKAVDGKITAKALTVKANGKVDTDLTADYKVGETTLDVGSTFVTALNANAEGGDVSTAAPAKTLKLTTGFILAGGSITDRSGNAISDFVANGASGSLTVKVADQSYNSVRLLDGGKFTVNATGTKVADLTVTSGVATVGAEGALEVGKLTTGATNASVVVNGTLTASAQALGLKNNATDKTLEKDTSTTNGSGKVENGTLQVTQNGRLVVTGLDDLTFKTTGLSALTGLTANDRTGVIDLGKATIEGLVSGGKVAFTALKDLQGITTEELKSATVTGVNATIDHSNSWGKVQLAAEDPVKVENATLTLNGGSGDIVFYGSSEISGQPLLKK